MPAHVAWLGLVVLRRAIESLRPKRPPFQNKRHSHGRAFTSRIGSPPPVLRLAPARAAKKVWRHYSGMTLWAYRFVRHANDAEFPQRQLRRQSAARHEFLI